MIYIIRDEELNNYEFKEDDQIFVIFQRERYFEVKDFLKDFKKQDDYSFIINWDNKFFDLCVFSNTKIKFNQIEILRDVIAAYKVDGKPKGWFYNEDGVPQRYTGLGNGCYFSKTKYDSDFSKVFMLILYKAFLKGLECTTTFKSLEGIEDFHELDKMIKE